jgi:hypothetical protein
MPEKWPDAIYVLNYQLELHLNHPSFWTRAYTIKGSLCLCLKLAMGYAHVSFYTTGSRYDILLTLTITSLKY